MKTEPAYYKARWIYPVCRSAIEGGIVAVAGDRIVSVGRTEPHKSLPGWPVRDMGDGVILPGLINAHTHLDLSSLRGRISDGIGFLQWVKSLLSLKEGLSQKLEHEALKESLIEIDRQGTLAVGDWTTSLWMEHLSPPAGLVFCIFYEIIGFAAKNLTLPEAFHSPVAHRHSPLDWISLGAHAPHTTSAVLLKAAKAWTLARSLPLSIHTAESKEEEDFLLSGNGLWKEFLIERGKWDNTYSPSGLRPVAYLDHLGLLDESTLCIHLTRANREELRQLAQKGVRTVICPRSNQFISGSLPDLPGMLAAGLSPALGTDSLASNQDLSLWNEMAFIRKLFPDISPKAILEMSTINGARALGLADHLGDLRPGKKAGMLFLPLKKCSARELPEAIIALTRPGTDLDLAWHPFMPLP